MSHTRSNQHCAYLKGYRPRPQDLASSNVAQTTFHITCSALRATQEAVKIESSHMSIPSPQIYGPWMERTTWSTRTSHTYHKTKINFLCSDWTLFWLLGNSGTWASHENWKRIQFVTDLQTSVPASSQKDVVIKRVKFHSENFSSMAYSWGKNVFLSGNSITSTKSWRKWQFSA